MSGASRGEDPPVGPEARRLLYVHAPWCAPCRLLGPALERVVRSCAEAGRPVQLVPIAFDEQASPRSGPTARESVDAGVRVVPTLILEVGGAEHSRRVGVLSPRQLRAWLLER